MANHGKKWNQQQYDEITKLYLDKVPIKDIADKMGRTPGSITSKLEELDVITFDKEVWPDEKLFSLKSDIQILANKYNQTFDDFIAILRFKLPKTTGVLGPKAPEPKAPEPKTPEEPKAPTHVKMQLPKAPTAQVEPIQEQLSPLNDEQEKAFNLFVGGKSLCLTGPAGTGKSHIIKHITKYCIANNKVFAITALTGVAASLVSGQTIHKWTGLGLIDKNVSESVTKIKSLPDALKRWKDINTLVIDEISMMDQDLFEKLNLIAQKVRGNKQFYGGIQVIFCGDFAQLGPVKSTGFAFESTIWLENLNSSTVLLTRVQRQDNPVFIKLLSEIRLGKVTKTTKAYLDSCIIDDLSEANTGAIKPTMLYPHRKTAETINANKLAELEYPKKTFKAVDNKYDFSKRGPVSVTKQDMLSLEERCPDEIVLCEKAQVMLTVNLDVESGLVNGSRGIITSFQNGMPVVLFDNTLEVKITCQSFESNITGAIVTRSQIPLILAWAMTIHKCQGSTISSVVTDLRDVFCPSQSYVTLSRVKTLEGLYLLGIDYSKIRCDPKVLEYYKCLETGDLYDKTSVSAEQEEETVMTNCLC